MNHLALRMKKYFSHKVKEGHESIDKRFLLKKTGIIEYNFHTTLSQMPVKKLLATLALPTGKLFCFLQATAKSNHVKKYSYAEKILISNFVRLAKIKRNLIASAKIRTICKS